MPTTFANTINGDEILAKRSQCDYSGNDIQTTYATKSELPTATSDLTNDSGFITSSDVPVKDVQVAGESVVNAQGIAEISIPSTGVLDVEVNGSSVVDAQGVASIDLSGYATDSELTSGLATKEDTISDLSTIRSGAALGETAVQPSDLATVALSGSYNDLLEKPSIPAAQVNADWDATSGVSEILNKPQFSTVATTGDYFDLQNLPSIPAAQVNSDWDATSGIAEILNKPSIPTATSDLTNDSGFITLSDVPAQVNADWNSSSGASEILNKPTIPSGAQLVPAATSADADKVLTVNAQGTPAWATAQAPISAGDGITIANNTVSAKVDGTTVTVNGSGQLQATQPTVDQTYNSSSANAQSGTAVAQAVATKENAFDVGTGLEMDTSGATPTLQMEAPVDIVAGPGIVIDNPDGNTLRVSQSTFGAWENITNQFTWETNVADNGVSCLYNSTLKLLWMQGYIQINVGTSLTKVCTLPSSLKTQLRITELSMASTLEEKHGLLSTNLDRTELNFKWVTAPSNKYVGFFLICPMEEL